MIRSSPAAVTDGPPPRALMRAQLEQTERPTALADAHLPVERRPTVGRPHQQHRQQKHGQDHQQQDPGPEHVERASDATDPEGVGRDQEDVGQFVVMEMHGVVPSPHPVPAATNTAENTVAATSHS